MASDDVMFDDERIETLRRLVDALDRQDLEAALELFADGAAFEFSRGPDPWGRCYVGAEQLREGIASRFRAIPEGRYGDDTHVVLGDRGFSECALRGRTAERQESDVRGCDIWAFGGDRIARGCSFWKIVER